MKDIRHYNVEFDQHDIITAIHFEGGPSVTMNESVIVVDEKEYQIVGVRDIIKKDSFRSENVCGFLLHPFHIEVHFDAMKK